jgi:metal-responsive CopG/Arc/MetJ family transcriptional regulator
MARRRFNIWLDEEVVRRFEESIKSTGMSVSQMIEVMMRFAVHTRAKSIEDIFDKIVDFEQKRRRK